MNRLKSLLQRFTRNQNPCAENGHLPDGCVCARCAIVLDASLHAWDGCKCARCGANKEAGDPAHEWQGCLCARCGAIRDEGHDWEEVSSKYFGGNDVNGWGPGGETVTTYACRRCGRGKEEVVKDDDE